MPFLCSYCRKAIPEIAVAAQRRKLSEHECQCGPTLSAIKNWRTENNFTPEPEPPECLMEQTQVSKNLAWKHCTTPPKVVTLCGSTRFMDQFFKSGWAETLAGRIVLSVGVVVRDGQGDEGPDDHIAEHLGVKDKLDEIHFRKIDLSDEILVLNLDGYVGESTQREIAYAMATGKKVRFLEEWIGEELLEARRHEIAAQVAAFLSKEVPDA